MHYVVLYHDGYDWSGNLGVHDSLVEAMDHALAVEREYVESYDPRRIYIEIYMCSTVKVGMWIYDEFADIGMAWLFTPNHKEWNFAASD